MPETMVSPLSLHEQDHASEEACGHLEDQFKRDIALRLFDKADALRDSGTNYLHRTRAIPELRSVFKAICERRRGG
jgi:hypothetical protein